jgi:hypothetical protein
MSRCLTVKLRGHPEAPDECFFRRSSNEADAFCDVGFVVAPKVIGVQEQ